MTKTAITETWKENEQYQLVPNGDDAWKVRILEGDYVESVISYGKLSIDEQNSMVTFDFSLDYSPDPDLKSTDAGLQQTAGYILHSILVNAFDEH